MENIEKIMLDKSRKAFYSLRCVIFLLVGINIILKLFYRKEEVREESDSGLK